MNNSMFTTNPPEETMTWEEHIIDVLFQEEDPVHEEIIDDYNKFKVYEMSEDNFLKWVKYMEESQ